MTTDVGSLAFTHASLYRADALSTGAVSAVLASRTQPAWLYERANQVRHLAQLEPNWDSYGANPVDQDSIRWALELLEGLAIIDTIEAPTVMASPDGHAALVWDNDDRSLEVEVMPDGSFRYVFLCPADASKDEEGTTRQPSRLAVLLTKWL